MSTNTGRSRLQVLRCFFAFNLPPRELQNVCHQRKHNGHLYSVEELDQTPVDITCCNSKYCPNEDRPASATDQSRDCSNYCAGGHAKALVTFFVIIKEPRLLIDGAIVSVEAFFLHLRVQWIFQ